MFLLEIKKNLGCMALDFFVLKVLETSLSFI